MELPQGWVETTIGDILQPQSDGKLIHQGWSPRCHPEPAGINDWGVLKTTAIQDGRFQESSNKKLPEDKSPKPRIEVQNGDLIMTNAGPRIRCGVTTLVKNVRPKLMLSGKMYRMRFNESYISPEYVEICLRSAAVRKQIDDRKTGMSESGLNLTQERFLTVPILLCPHEEQIRIADKVGTLLAKVDSAQARLEKIPHLLKRFRQSILAAATSGDLTGQWRLENKPNKWATVTLLDVIESPPRNGYSPKGVGYKTPVKNLTLSAVTKGYFVEDCFKYVDIDISKDSHLWVKKNDILIQRANSIDYVGISSLYEGEDDSYIYPDLIMKCRANKGVNPKYLHYSLLSENVRKYFRENATGTAGNMPKINQKVVSSAPINLPSPREQGEIVRHVESLFFLANSIEKQYLEAKKRTDRLARSIIAKAFRGELVPQNPNNQSASELLKRIQAEREPKVSNSNLKDTSIKQKKHRNSNTSKSKKTTAMKLTDTPESYLLDLLSQSGGEAHAEILWKKTDLAIDDFYAKLKQEMRDGQIVEDNNSSDPAFRKLKCAPKAS